MKAVLVLENGSIFEGVSLGAKGTAVGEVVFNCHDLYSDR